MRKTYHYCESYFPKFNPPFHVSDGKIWVASFRVKQHAIDFAKEKNRVERYKALKTKWQKQAEKQIPIGGY